VSRDRLREAKLMCHIVVVKEEVDEAEDIKVDAPAEVKPELKTEAEEMVQEEV
jgi:hypothetical protein